ncbi:MAG TPA: hypothetical protein VEM37_01605, partial [Nitrospiraceae bacterium]|nr:hypothetical protein [Nitrospiraceae bacterium]
TSLLCSYHKFLQPLSPQLIWLGLVSGLMMSRDHRIDDRATVETAPGGDLIFRRAQFKIIIPLSNHQPIATLTYHTAPPLLNGLCTFTCGTSVP